jgi:Mg-chelatase subunit ChlD
MLRPGESGQRELLFFIIDVSGSMEISYDERFSKIEAAKRANATMLVQKAQLDADDVVGLVSFNHTATLLEPLSVLREHKTQILRTLQSLQADGGTDINLGLETARDHFHWDRSGVVRRVVLLTDGHGGNPLGTAAYLKERGVVIDVIGIGASPTAVNELMLREVASVIQGGSRYSFIKDQQTLVAHYTQLACKTRVGF